MIISVLIWGVVFIIKVCIVLFGVKFLNLFKKNSFIWLFIIGLK